MSHLQKDALDPNVNYNILQDLLVTAFNDCIPFKKYKVHKHKNKKSEWITLGLIKSIQYRDNLYKKLKQMSVDSVDFERCKHNLKVYNKILKKSIREAKAAYYYKKFDTCKSDSKKTWSAINEVLKRSDSRAFPDYVIVNQQKIIDQGHLVNHFNNYFGNIGTSMAASIPNVNNVDCMDYLDDKINSLFKFKPVTNEQVYKIINQLKSKPSVGHDGLSTITVKYLASLLTEPLTLLINQSLKAGIFPDKLKLAKIIPIHKKDDVHLLENYRPISVLPSLSKVVETVVFEQMFTYFIDNELLSTSQYGFRKKHSTEHAVLEAVDRISSELDNGNTPLSIFLDLSRAFDTLDYKILFSKLNYYGIKNIELDWIRSYLTNRTHYVHIEQNKSDTIPISVGVPQGSILGPLLFLIYLNDIQKSSAFFTFIKYADDTNLLNSMSDINLNNLDVVNTEFTKVYQWLCVNRLSLNIKKTKFIMFHNKNKDITHLIPNIMINNIEVERVKTFNFLGIDIDEYLSWNSHVDKICTKVSKTVGILCKLEHVLPVYILKTLYNSLILPHLTYGVLLWGRGNTRLFTLQKKAVRIITNSKFNAHTNPIFKDLCFLKVVDIYNISVLKFYYLYCHNQLPFYLQAFALIHRSDVHNYDTRNKSLLNINRVKNKSC
jgi:hypothetical protein